MKVKVFAPATIANICAGFDVLGVALEDYGDYVTVQKIKEKKLHFSVETTIAQIPLSPEKNIAAHIAQLMMAELKLDFGIDLLLHKKMPIGSGLGSSAASSVATAVAVNALLDKPLDKKALLHFAVEGEWRASGARHADNVAPCLFGGGCIVRHEQFFDVIPFAVHPDLRWVVILPELTITTASARNVLPTTLSLALATQQMGNVSGFLIGLLQGDRDILRRCAVDLIAEPVRQTFIPGFAATKATALEYGALAVGISGSGPAIFALCAADGDITLIADKMLTTMKKVGGLSAQSFISGTNLQGARIIETIV